MRNIEPYFSIVIPLYNKENYIADCLESISRQSFTNYEVIIVNDGSTDGSLEVISKCNLHNIKVINKENGGVSSARNEGIANTKGNYIAFLDADDIWLNNYLEELHHLITSYPTAGMYGTNFVQVDKVGNIKERKLRGLPEKNYFGIVPNFFKCAHLGDYPVWTSAICVPKRVFETEGILFPNGEKFAEDQHVWSRIAMLYDVAFSEKVCAYYMIESENNTVLASTLVSKPHDSITSLYQYRSNIKIAEELYYFDLYMSSWMYYFTQIEVNKGNVRRSLINMYYFKMTFKDRLSLLAMLIIPRTVRLVIKKFIN